MFNKEKKIQKNLEYTKSRLQWIEENGSKVDEETSPKKKKQIIKNIEAYKNFIAIDTNDILKWGGNLDSLVDELTPYQLAFLKKICPQGFTK